MRLLDTEQARQRVAGWLGGDPASETGFGEALRLELLAAGALPGHQLLGRVWRRLGLGESARPRLAEALALLTQAGDAVAGPGGLIAAAPVRLIEAGHMRYVLLGTVGTAAACALVPGASVERGCPRRLSNLAPAGAEALAEAMGGCVLSLARWSGLHRAPVARACLERLEGRLSGARPGELVSLADQGDLALFEASPGGRPGWRAGQPRARALARAWRHDGDAFGLLVSDDERGLALPLSRDEAWRAAWGRLARDGVARVEAVRVGEGLRRVSWPMRLPRAEWRALRMLDRASEAAQSPAVVVGDEDMELVAGLLSERLGAQLHLEQAEAAEPRDSPENSENS